MKKRRWFPKKPICEGGARGFQTVGLQEVKPAIIFYVVGIAVAFGIMLLEVIYLRLSTLLRERSKKKPKFKNKNTCNNSNT